MKILIVSNGFPPASFGGVEVYSYDLARELRRRGHAVQVFCRDSDATVPDYTVRNEIVERLPVKRVINNHKRASAFQDLYEDETIHRIFSDTLDAFQPDFVHYNHLLALSVTLPRETAWRGIPSLTMLHDYWSICQRVNLVDRDQRICPGPRRGGNCQTCVFGPAGASGGLVQILKKLIPYRQRVWLRKWLRLSKDTGVHFDPSQDAFQKREKAFRGALTNTDRVLVPSQFVQEMLAANEMASGQIEVLPLGIGLEPRVKHGRPEGTLRFAYAGSVAPLKGLETLLHAFRRVDIDTIRLDIYGREDLNPQFAQELHRLAQGDPRIVFHGPFSPDQRNEIYGKIDVFVMPSVCHETFSLVAREALQCGAPVIASRVGALQELVHEGINGFLFPPGDVDALSGIIRRIGEQPDCLSMLKIPGPIDIISNSQHVDRIEKIYNQLIREKKEALE